MELLIILLLPVILIVAVVASRKKKKTTPQEDDSIVSGGDDSAVLSSRNKMLIENVKKRLTANPKDSESLKTLADLYYDDKNFEEAAKQYATLMGLVQSGAVPPIDLYDVRVKHGLSSLKAKKYEEAFQSLSGAFAAKKEMNSDLVAGLGECEYYRKNYERSSHFLKMVVEAYPENIPARKYLGMDYFKLKKYSEAAAMLRQVLAAESSDKELVFTLANAYNEINKQDNALKLFTHLRADPVYGPASALYSGSIHASRQNYDLAVADFEIGLKHGNMRTELLLELKYRLANVYLQQKNPTQALELLNQIRSINPSFKNVAQEIQRYSEIVSNKNFAVYVGSSTPEFISLCRKSLPFIFPKAKIKISNVFSDRSDYIDILTEVKTAKMEDSILFRFYRTEGTIDEPHVRDLYTKIKGNHVGRGFAISPGIFTPTAQTFVEARLIDLMDKPDLLKVLTKVQ